MKALGAEIGSSFPSDTLKKLQYIVVGTTVLVLRTLLALTSFCCFLLRESFIDKAHKSKSSQCFSILTNTLRHVFNLRSQCSTICIFAKFAAAFFSPCLRSTLDPGGIQVKEDKDQEGVVERGTQKPPKNPGQSLQSLVPSSPPPSCEISLDRIRLRQVTALSHSPHL